MNNINEAKLRRLLNDADDAAQVVRALSDRLRGAVEHCAFTAANVYRRPVLLDVHLHEFFTWAADDLRKAEVTLAEVRAAIEARADAAELQQRLAAARAAAAPKLRLAARLRDVARPQGKYA